MNDKEKQQVTNIPYAKTNVSLPTRSHSSGILCIPSNQSGPSMKQFFIFGICNALCRATYM
jgi:hypothetical protein